MKSIIVFASGAGSNFSSIMQYAKTTDTFSIALLVVNKEDAPVIQLAKEQAIPVLLLNKETFNSTEWIATLTAYQPSLIVLAGFLWKLPEHLVNAFPNKIINIHPALLPNIKQ
jgi:phosphoribosylglycinamide formyltransferase-1